MRETLNKKALGKRFPRFHAFLRNITKGKATGLDISGNVSFKGDTPVTKLSIVRELVGGGPVPKKKDLRGEYGFPRREVGREGSPPNAVSWHRTTTAETSVSQYKKRVNPSLFVCQKGDGQIYKSLL
ncbi:MAG: hypothetical protein A3C80_01215 [Candidatus Ryanbacteria bacterium RIFCSPHIGHO2_02_FULL_45_43]|uniref:Uncharacterized protein n=1 Tax=Candidatus Ryanbacteria bacterium RIFCSPHIGHO2_01_45_13 TaxID=1802112 RepID=A0A1G2FYP7_9BACT|nr:MAG: hypothetical protein A2718_03445 [Candidatus Ryanbacteria bacterium RIFCSPHIGHO2_01_FULL_44_130]OGZ42862.1 MAG: hypothetical protein A2W41_01930 [Candidatus Ryanbacteria bacterium RIFCSPHIGHO2_01_45_13]OGZ48144.1 MAG: hypothetical protein A3C80_01215 [Candidatus Ryanbacteria bacterium RIFCSPHIGHO2_02_FULL_45_43]OGZ49791.1 MAG: hypothetical protein A3E55_01040 [Candidatus Ryanbacteria bacterium RIFCSPHIGHO2_12_FULL_44_20]OGZ51218.1 MAG: hypothetical protein A3A17_04250 [Candidatus Ryanba